MGWYFHSYGENVWWANSISSQNLFETALKSAIYPDKWKKANVVPVHNKESKNI